MVIGERMRHHGDAETTQHGEEALGIADAGHGMHALSGERRQRARAPTGDGSRLIGQQAHRPFAEARAGVAVVVGVTPPRFTTRKSQRCARSTGSRSGPAGSSRALP